MWSQRWTLPSLSWIFWLLLSTFLLRSILSQVPRKMCDNSGLFAIASSSSDGAMGWVLPPSLLHSVPFSRRSMATYLTDVAGRTCVDGELYISIFQQV